MSKITVMYWRGATQLKGVATTYRGAMRIASRNQNAFPPTYYDEYGNKLYDTGYNLEKETSDNGNI